MSLEEQIKKFICDELDKRAAKENFLPIEDFCRLKKISRTTVWRARKAGTIKTVHIRGRAFIDTNQFSGV